jgi:adenine-specific DNA-methyltransferase
MQKLELTWVGKGDQPKLEPRLLLLQPDHCHGDPLSDNMLIHGDNLLALKALEQQYTGKVKCIYIDPPYNTGNAFKYYDDGIEHSLWLNLIANRIKILHSLLSQEGSFFIQLDENEVDYCKILLDEVFSRGNFINRITIDVRAPSAFSTVNPGVFKSSEYLLWYAKDKSSWEKRSLRIPSVRDQAYDKYLKYPLDKVENWQFSSLSFAFLEDLNKERLSIIKAFVDDLSGFAKSAGKISFERYIIKQFAFQALLKKSNIDYLWKKLDTLELDGFKQTAYAYLLEKCSFPYKESDLSKFVFINANHVFRETEISDEGAGQDTVDLKYLSLQAENTGRVLQLHRPGFDNTYIRNGKQLSFYNKNVIEFEGQRTASRILTNIWTDVSWEGISKEGEVQFKKGKKPEKLIKRCFDLATNPGDLVLDSFLGSGTTAAVAHKMGRRWIGIELGDHCYTHCVPRLQKVVSGTDQGGISKAMAWKGGGGFKTYTLAPSLLKNDEQDVLSFNPDFTDGMIAEAVAKLEGFTYQPEPAVFWKQARSSEHDYMLVTKIFVTREWLSQLHEQMQAEESLLICCPAFGDGCERAFSNISLKKIPNAFMRKYEFGKDDYSLNVSNVLQEQSIDSNDDDPLPDQDAPVGKAKVADLFTQPE